MAHGDSKSVSFLEALGRALTPDVLGALLVVFTSLISINIYVNDRDESKALIPILFAYALALLLLVVGYVNRGRQPAPDRPEPPSPPDPWWKRLLKGLNRIATDYKDLIAAVGVASGVVGLFISKS